MSENPRDPRSGIPVRTPAGIATQYYLPGCAPEEVNRHDRPEVYRFSLLLRSILRHYSLTLDETQDVVQRIFREMNRT